MCARASRLVPKPHRSDSLMNAFRRHTARERPACGAQCDLIDEGSEIGEADRPFRYGTIFSAGGRGRACVWAGSALDRY
jgi:hypothetical protein